MIEQNDLETKSEQLRNTEDLRYDTSGFTLLEKIAPEIIADIRYYSDYNFIGERIDGYEEPVIITTKPAAAAIKKANDDLLLRGYCFKIFDAYRPQRAVEHFSRWMKDQNDQRMKPDFFPRVDKQLLFELDYLAPQSSHSRGSTFDLTICNRESKKELDMGGTFDLFDVRSHPDHKRELTTEQYNNRMTLRELMIKHGFKPLSTEWWHFTLVDEPYPNTYFTFPVNSSVVDEN